MLEEPTWGIDVPSCRTWGYSPTFGSLVLFFFRKSTTRSFYVMNFSQVSLRGVEIWHIWKQHHVVECFWKMMQSIFQIRSMQSATSGKAGGLKKVEPLKADRRCEPLKAV